MSLTCVTKSPLAPGRPQPCRWSMQCLQTWRPHQLGLLLFVECLGYEAWVRQERLWMLLTKIGIMQNFLQHKDMGWCSLVKLYKPEWICYNIFFSRNSNLMWKIIKIKVLYLKQPSIMNSWTYIYNFWTLFTWLAYSMTGAWWLW